MHCGVQADAGLQANEKRIYELIARHFLACCSQNAEVRVFENQTYPVRIA